MTDRQTDRQSNYELLKIIAMVLIVICHSTIRYIDDTNPAFYNPIDNNGIQSLLMMLFGVFGNIGNCIFVICSSYFLVESDRIKWQKVFAMLLDTWILSFIGAIIAVFMKVGFGDMVFWIRTLAPITGRANWFVGCYILLYIIHPVLNRTIYDMNKHQLLMTTLCLIVMYSVIATIASPVDENAYYYTELVGFILIYFITACFKICQNNFSKSFTKSLIIFLVSLSILVASLYLSKVLAAKYQIVKETYGLFFKMNNPIIIALSMSLFNLLSMLKIKSKTINAISSVTLIIYLIHENITVRQQIIPRIWIVLHKCFGYDYIIVLRLALAIFIFTVSLCLALIYRKTLGCVTERISNIVSNKKNEFN